MTLSKSSEQLKKLIEKAIEDHELTRDEYDEIIHLATLDGHVDTHEKALLEQLQDMIENKSVQFRKK